MVVFRHRRAHRASPRRAAGAPPCCTIGHHAAVGRAGKTAGRLACRCRAARRGAALATRLPASTPGATSSNPGPGFPRPDLVQQVRPLDRPALPDAGARLHALWLPRVLFPGFGRQRRLSAQPRLGVSAMTAAPGSRRQAEVSRQKRPSRTLPLEEVNPVSRSDAVAGQGCSISAGAGRAYLPAPPPGATALGAGPGAPSARRNGGGERFGGRRFNQLAACAVEAVLPVADVHFRREPANQRAANRMNLPPR